MWFAQVWKLQWAWTGAVQQAGALQRAGTLQRVLRMHWAKLLVLYKAQQLINPKRGRGLPIFKEKLFTLFKINLV